MRWPFGWVLLATVVVVAAVALAFVHRLDLDQAMRLGLDLSVLALAVPLLGWFGQRLIRFRPPAQLDSAVAQVLLGRTVVGSATRVDGRLLLTSARAVSWAIGRTADADLLVAPRAGEQVRLRFSGRPGGDVHLWARVVLWGPGRADLRNPDVVLLRAVGRLPWRIARLPVASGRYEGLVRAIPADDPHGCVVSPDRSAELRDGDLTADVVAGPSRARSGAPLVAGTDADGEVVALLTPKVSNPADTARTTLVDSTDMRVLLRQISRRRLLGAGGAGLAAAGLAAAGLSVTGSSEPKGLLGAGWKSLFEDGDVLAHLAGQKLPPIRDIVELSGVESVDKAPSIPHLDFVTAPNEIVADALLKRFDKDSRTCGSYRICVDEMVVVARHSVLEPLKGAGLLTRPADTDCARFDVHTYLRYFLPGGRGGLPLEELPGDLRLRYSNPKSAGGGVMLLMMLVDLCKRMRASYGGPPDLFWLLDSSGPMFATGSANTRELFDELTNRSGPHLAFVYEHDAIAFLSKPEAGGPYVMLRTNPYARLTQKLIGVTPAGMQLGSRFDPSDGRTGPAQGLPELLNRQLHLRSVGYNDAVERDFRTGPFRTMLLPSDFATQTERRLEQTALPNFPEIRDLIDRLPR